MVPGPGSNVNAAKKRRRRTIQAKDGYTIVIMI